MLFPRSLLLLLAFSIGAQAQFTTAAHSPFAAGSTPQAIVISDFNGDFWNDMAVADFNGNAVTVLINNHAAGGGFTSTSYPVGHGPNALALGDFNGDTLTDLAVLNSTDHTVTILYGDGEGNFTVDPHGPFPSGPQPTALGVGNFDGDAGMHQDLAITNFTGTVTVLLGDGAGSFTAMSGSPFAVGAGPRGLAVADFNDDNISDLAIANSIDNTVTILRGGSSMAPALGSPFPTGSTPVALTVADFNHDMLPDIAVANNADGTVTILLNTGSNFTQPPGSPIPAGSSPTSVQASFLSGAPAFDLAVTNANGFVTVLFNAGNGQFVPAPQSPFAVGSSPAGLALGNMRGIDVPNDISIANSGSNTVTILYNTGLFSFGPEIATPILSSTLPADVPDHINAITAGTTPIGGGINLWIGGYFDTNDPYTVTWNDTGAATSIDLTGDIVGTTTSLVELTIPDSLWATLVSSVDTVNIVVTDTTLHLSASAPFFINPRMAAPQTCFQGAAQGVPYTQTYVTGGTQPFQSVSYGSGSGPPPGFPNTPTVPMTATATATGNYSFSFEITDAWNNVFFGPFFNLQVAGIPSIGISPSSVPAGSPDTPLNVTGLNLLQPSVFNSCNFAGSQIFLGPSPGGTPLATTVSSSSAASATVPGALLQSPGTVLVMVQQPGPGGAGSNLAPLMILGPAISGLSPPSVNAGAAGFTLTVNGSSYLPGSQIVFGGTPLATTFSGSGTLTAQVSASQVSAFGPVNVTVVNPGGSTSPATTFTVMASAISALVPVSVVAGSPGFTLTVNGPAFVSGSQIFFGATGLTTTFVNGTTLTAPITAAMVSLAGPVPITVVSPGPFTTPPFTFTVTPNPHPTPTITLPLQSSVLAAAGPTFGNAITSGTAIPGFLLYVNGFFNDGFSHTVTWLNTLTNAATTFTTSAGIVSVSPTQIVVTIPATLFSLVSGQVTANVTVTEQQAIPSPPPPVTSNAAPFLINPPLATTAVTFADGTVGTAYSQALSFTGGSAPFTSSLFSGTLAPGLSLSPAAGPLAGIPTAPGSFSFAIQIADAWGNAAHASDTLEVVAVPAIVPPLIPGSALAGTAALQLTVNGTNFIGPLGAQPGSVVEWIAPGSSPVALPTVVVSAIQLTATVSASLLASPTTAGIVVLQPNGVASNNVPFPVLGPSISTLAPSSITAGSLGFTLSVSGSNFESGSQILFGGTALTTTFVSSSSLTATVNAPQVAIPGPVNVTVVNPGSVPSAAAIFTVMVNPFPTPVILPPLQSSLLTSTTPTLGHGITGGANLTGFKLYINGNFDAGDNTTVTWMNTGTNVSTTFTTTTGIESVSPTQIVVIVPASLFSQTLVIQQTVNVTVTQQEPIASPPPAVTSNSAPFFINPKPNTDLTIFPSGTPGVPFSFTGPIIGGSPPFTFTVLSGTLPPGLTLTPDGTLSGTPTVPGDFSFGIQITDVWGDTLVVEDYMQVAGPPSITVGIAPSSAPAGTAGLTVTINGNGFLAPASAGSGMLPGTVAEWLSPGSPPVALATTITSDSLATALIPASLLASPVAAQIVMMQPTGLTSNPMPFTVLPPVLSSLLPASATAGSAGFTLTASGANFLNGSQLSFGGTALATTFLGAGTLTAPVSAALVSKAGTYNVTVTNPGGAISAAIAFPVLSKITILTASLPLAQTGVLYDVVLAATGGTAPYTWSATGLPVSVSLNPATGEIRGSWNTTGSFTVTASVVDSAGQSASMLYTVAVGTTPVPLQFTGALSLPPATVGTPYSTSFGVTGGPPPYTFSLVSAAPPGLSIVGGMLTGTPSTPGQYSFGVLVKDSLTGTATATFQLTVSPAALVVTGSVSNSTVGSTLSVQFGATGGVPPYTFSASGTLPTGASFSAGMLSGTLTAPGTFIFAITAVDSAGASATKAFTVTVTTLPLNITTTGLPNGVVGTAYTAMLAASGGAPAYTWSATGLPAGLSISAAGAITGTPTTTGSYTVSATVADTAGGKFSQNFPLTIAPAGLTITTSSLPNGTVGSAYSASLAASGGAPPYTWSANSLFPLPPGLSISPAGAITGTPTASGSYSIAVMVADTLGAKASQTFPVTIAASGSLSITTTSLPGGAVGTAYSATLTAAGGSAPYTWLVTGLPSGLTASIGGSITGTPTASSSFTVAVTVTDSKVGTATRSYTLNILTGSPVISGLSPTLAAAGGPSFVITVTGTNFSSGAQILFGGTPLNPPAAGAALPAVRLRPRAMARPIAQPLISSQSTTTLTGLVPAALIAQPGQIAVTVVDPGVTPSAPVTFTVTNRLTLLTTTIPTGPTGSAYSFTLQATGGAPPYSWSVTGLPNSIILNPVAGTLSGIWTTAGTYSGVITVTDSSGQSAFSQYSTSITSPVIPLQVVTSSLQPATVGTPYGATFFANGGTPPYSFSFTGAAPPGLVFAGGSNGALSGTPTTAGLFTFGVTVTDNNSGTASKSFVLTVGPAALTVTGSVSDAVVGATLNDKFAATGGVPPYSFSSAGSLPAGATFGNTGALSGTLTAAGTFTFAVTATDSAQSTASKSFTIHVTAPPLTISGSLPNGQVGVAYGAQATASGGAPPYTWSTGGLPPGLSASAGGSITGTPTTAGAYSVALTVTDSAGTHASQSYPVTITGAALMVTTASLSNGTVGTAYSASLAAAGGVQPYTWTVSGLPAGLSGSAAGSISGTPTTAGNYTVGATVTDAKGTTASASLALLVTPATLTITTTSLSAGTVGTAVSAALAATGGVPPYTWTVGGLPGGLTASAAGAISGTPTAPGSFTVAATVTDSVGTTASASLAWIIALPAMPPLTFSGLPATGTSASQPSLQVSLGSAYPLPVTVALTLTFTPGSGPDDPSVQFSTGGRTATITVAAGQTAGATSVAVQTGTVAGTITIAAQMTAAGQDVTPSPAPNTTIKIGASAPVITSVTAAASSGGFTVTIVGYSNTRDLTQGAFTFTAASGANLQTGSVTVPLSTAFIAWYQSAAAAPFGSQFTLTQPFTVSGNQQAVASLSVTLTNSVGTSAAVTTNNVP